MRERDTSGYTRIELPKAGPDEMLPPAKNPPKPLVLGPEARMHHPRITPGHVASDNYQAVAQHQYEGSGEGWFHR